MAKARDRRLLSPGDPVYHYTTVSLIGQGGYGDVYCVRRSESHPLYAMKVEAIASSRHGLERELLFLGDLQDSPLFPALVESGRTATHLYLVEELLGPSLSQLRRKMADHHFTIPTVLRLAVFMFACIRDLHGHGVVHRDVKPGNFLLKATETNPLALIDFGLSKRYIDPDTGMPYPERQRCGFHGTSRYASTHAHSSRDQCPRDDLASWLYSVAELAEGRLPWAADRDLIVVHRKKVLLPDRTLLRALPPQFTEIAAYLRTLRYDSPVNYDWVLMLLCQAVGPRAGRRDLPFDWESLPQHVIAQLTTVQRLPLAIDYRECIPREMIPPAQSDRGLCCVA
jgi:serine/threonine protein kinase